MIQQMKLDTAPHANEGALKALVGQATGNPSVVDQARAAGVPWLTILALLAQYGPAAMQILQQIIAALLTPPPAKTP